jgi:hypothetical protein
VARNYDREYDTYQGKPSSIRDRAQRNAARALMKKKVGEKVLAGKDVGHKRSIKDGGTNSPSNLRIESIKANRSRK